MAVDHLELGIAAEHGEGRALAVTAKILAAAGREPRAEQGTSAMSELPLALALVTLAAKDAYAAGIWAAGRAIGLGSAVGHGTTQGPPTATRL